MVNPIKYIWNRVRVAVLKRKKKKLETKYQKYLDFQEYMTDDPLWLYEKVEDRDVQKALEIMTDYEWQIVAIETPRFRRRMERWNIRMNRDWLTLYYNKQREELHLFMENARKEIAGLIKVKRKESIEWWITKVVVPLAGVITGLVGILVALIALKY